MVPTPAMSQPDPSALGHSRGELLTVVSGSRLCTTPQTPQARLAC